MTERWSAERAHDWIRARGWRVGCNFAPSSAASQLEMWQAPTFDLETNARELGMAADLGFTGVRVFLHDLLWDQDRDAFLSRVDAFLGAAGARGIGALLVLFDGVWDPHPEPGPQPEPRPRVHNSRWVQGPGAAILGDPARHASLRPYVQGVLEHFRSDARIDGWDLFNEADNPNPAYARQELPDKGERALQLLRSVHDWAREVAPSQPLTTGVWRGSWSDAKALTEFDRFCLESSDVISFHHYGPLGALEHRVESLRRYGRPILCTEFMARGLGSCFDPHLRFLRDAGVGAYNWGLVAGRTQTQYPWDSWSKPYADEPRTWHHEILRPDGSPWDSAEAEFIRSVTTG